MNCRIKNMGTWENTVTALHRTFYPVAQEILG